MEINDSSLLTEAEWTAEDGLTVTFKSNNSRYRYAGVPFHVWSDLQSAQSKGSFFMSQIKGQYDSEKL